MAGNLEFINELGMGMPSDESTESQTEDTTSNPETDLSIEPMQKVEEATKEEVTEPKELVEMRKQIEVMEKRIKDKDDYIQKLREESQAKELAKEEPKVDDEDDFWNDPVGKYKSLQQTLQVQQLQIAETIYANTVDNYWKTVNQDALKEAVATDAEFAKEFNSSREPYKTAYEYLTAKKESKLQADKSLRDKIREEILAEMNVTKTKETIPNVASMTSKTSSSTSDANDDGFMAVFKRR